MFVRILTTMKVTRILPVLLLLMTACAPKERTVDFPAVGATNNDYIIIEKVEMTDSLTYLHIRGYHFPGSRLLRILTLRQMGRSMKC